MQVCARRSSASRISLILLTIVQIGCGANFKSRRPADDERPEFNLSDEQSKTASHLLFSTINPFAYPSKASIQQLSLASGEVETVLTGESSDPAIFSAGSQVLLFNRTSESQNFRKIGFRDDKRVVQAGAQMQFAGGQIGDPHDALVVSGGRVILAHYLDGSLSVVKLEDGSLMKSIRANWDLPKDVTFKPEALVRLQGVNGEELVYVIHQAFSLQDGSMIANGSQSVFILRVTADDIEPLDLDLQKDGIQGIKTKGSFPIPVRYAGRNKLTLVSMCSLYVKADPSFPCVNSVEEIDPLTNKSEELWDLKGQEVFMNGGITPGADESNFFANILTNSTSGELIKVVAQFDIAKKSLEVRYTFAADSAGYWGSFFDQQSKTLYVGDSVSSSAGKFTIIKNGETSREISLVGTPYSGAFLFSAP